MSISTKQNMDKLSLTGKQMYMAIKNDLMLNMPDYRSANATLDDVAMKILSSVTMVVASPMTNTDGAALTSNVESTNFHDMVDALTGRGKIRNEKFGKRLGLMLAEIRSDSLRIRMEDCKKQLDDLEATVQSLEGLIKEGAMERETGDLSVGMNRDRMTILFQCLAHYSEQYKLSVAS